MGYLDDVLVKEQSSQTLLANVQKTIQSLKMFGLDAEPLEVIAGTNSLFGASRSPPR